MSDNDKIESEQVEKVNNDGNQPTKTPQIINAPMPKKNNLRMYPNNKNNKKLWSYLHPATIDIRPKTRVVISMSTIPSRIGYLTRTLNSFVAQTQPLDRVYINIPVFSIREQINYDIDRIREIARGYEPLVYINYGVPDDGPLSKLLGTLDLEKDPNTFIILSDDDTAYAPDMVATLFKYADLKAVSTSGRRGVVAKTKDPKPDQPKYTVDLPYFCNPGHVSKVSFLEAVSGSMYRRDLFPQSSDQLREWVKGLPDDARFVDDIVIGAWLSLHKIPCYMVPTTHSLWQHDHDAPNALSQTGNLTWRNQAVFADLYEKGYFKNGTVSSSVRTLNDNTTTIIILSVAISISFVAGLSFLVLLFASPKKKAIRDS